MRIKHGVLKEISIKTGKSIPFLSDLASARKRAGRKMAKILAEASNVSEVIWLYGSSDEIKKALNNSLNQK
jgi:hypothetical protein